MERAVFMEITLFFIIDTELIKSYCTPKRYVGVQGENTRGFHDNIVDICPYYDHQLWVIILMYNITKYNLITSLHYEIIKKGFI